MAHRVTVIPEEERSAVEASIPVLDPVRTPIDDTDVLERREHALVLLAESDDGVDRGVVACELVHRNVAEDASQ
jgi:hypothetical protein